MITLVILSLVALLLLTRLLTLPSHPPPRPRNTPTRLLIVLGSGGHTAEMLSLLRTLDPYSYTHRTYLLSSGDSFSAEKALAFEAQLLEKVQKVRREMGRGEEEECWGLRGAFYGSYDVRVVPRARRVHQGLWSTPWSCVRCLFACFAVLRSPQLPPSTNYAIHAVPTRSFPLPRLPHPALPTQPAPSSPQSPVGVLPQYRGETEDDIRGVVCKSSENEFERTDLGGVRDV
ncbi:UDP-N-acetylglucosamine transferase subunit [Trapelia coarctata]|nr:UDP-N-acetylglucosamine transferase subunit [Trapelia coarctata]